MTRVAGRYASAVLLAWAGLTLSGCSGDSDTYQDASVATEQLAAEATQRMCDIVATCCLEANFPYQEPACKANTGPGMLQHFRAQIFLGAVLDTGAAHRCLDAIGNASDGCPLERVGDLPEACDWVFKGTVPVGGKCDASHGCATTRDAPLSCHLPYEPGGERFASSGVCIANPPPVFVHPGLGEACTGTCVSGDDCGGAYSEGSCYTSEGLVCSWQSNQCELQGVSGDPCQGTGDCVNGLYCEFADFKCAPTRPLGEPCTEEQQCESEYCSGTCSLRPRVSANSCLGIIVPPTGAPGTGGRAPN